jgi:16S rRNA (guanine527-N7)-methyltransferase
LNRFRSFAHDLLAIHRRLLERRRRSMNLVGPGDIEEHYLDATLGLGRLELYGNWADLGSGAGFPGIVLAAMFPEVALDLVERRTKRAVFLESVLLEAKDVLARRPAPVRVLPVDSEALPAAAYDGIVARALAPPEDVLASARRLLKPGGMAVLFLQGDVRPPVIDGFTVAHVGRYVLGGRKRQTVAWRLGVVEKL